MNKLLLLIFLLIPIIAQADIEIGTSGTNLGIGTSSAVKALSVVGGVGIGTTGTDPYSLNGQAGGMLVISGNVGVGTYAPTAPLQVATVATAGTFPNFNYPSITLQTTPAAGDGENDGHNLYFTPAGTQRGAILAPEMMAFTGNQGLGTYVATAIFKSLGTSSGGGMTLSSSTTYHFKLNFALTGISATSGSISLTFATTGTIGSIFYSCIGTKSTAVNTATATSEFVYVNQASATIISAANTTTTAAELCDGMIRMTSSGTVTPTVSGSASGTGPTVLSNSYFYAEPTGPSTGTSIGNIV